MENNYHNAPYLIIIELNQAWHRKSEFDMPSSGLVREIISDPIRHVESFIRSFNSLSLDRHSNGWAALTWDKPIPGYVVKILPILIDSE